MLLCDETKITEDIKQQLLAQGAREVQFLRTSDVAKLLNVSYSTVWKMEKNNRMPPKIALTPTMYVWKARDIYEWIESL